MHKITTGTGVNLSCLLFMKLIYRCLNSICKSFGDFIFRSPHDGVFLSYVKMQICILLAKLNNRLAKSHCISFLKISTVVLMC